MTMTSVCLSSFVQAVSLRARHHAAVREPSCQLDVCGLRTCPSVDADPHAYNNPLLWTSGLSYRRSGAMGLQLFDLFLCRCKC